MSTGSMFKRLGGVFVLCAVTLCVGTLNAVDTASARSNSTHKKAKKQQPQLPALPSGPTGPVPQVPLDSIKPVAPQVSFQNGQLTIVAPNSTLGDILRAVRKQTGAEIEIPDAQDRVVTHLGPGPARAVVAELLNGSRFNYVLLGSPEDPNQLTRVVLVAKSTPDNAGSNNPGAQTAHATPPPQQETAQDADADASDDNNNADDNMEQPQPPAEPAEQPAEQNGAKTPQQMLQEMQQRQLQFQQQLQQQQQSGQPPMPGPGVPPRPPQQPPDQQ
jgi:hypothetical protein